MPPAGDALGFMRRMWALNHRLSSFSKRMRARFGITGPQRLVVRMIGHAPGISAGALAAALHMDPSTLTGVLRRLEAGGIIRRRRDAADGRRMLFRLTRRGRGIDRMREGTVEAAVRRALRRARGTEVAAAERMLERVADELAGIPLRSKDPGGYNRGLAPRRARPR